MSITFLSKEELCSVIHLDNDNYYSTFSIYDLRARNVTSIDEYKQKSCKAIKELKQNYRKKIENYTRIIDYLLKDISLPWFNGKKAAKIPWKIGYIYNYNCEGGLAHTRGDIIMITRNSLSQLFETLIHEKVHVYQKMYKKDTMKYLDLCGYKKLRKRKDTDRIRANPDIDEWIYKKGNRSYKCVYLSEYPLSITDVKGVDYEHPFELMAEEIEKTIININEME
jgi:hypothetical protein